MTNTDKERADFEEWRAELLDLIFHYANGAMLNGTTELKRHIARIERQIDAVPCAGREAERAEAVTDAEPVAKIANRFGDPEAFAERELVVLADISKMPIGTKLYTHPPKPEPSPDVGPVRAALEAAHKLKQPRLEEPDRAVFWLVVDALHDLKFWRASDPKPEPSPDVEALTAPLDDIHVRDGFCDWADVANARDEIKRLIIAALTKPEGK